MTYILFRTYVALWFQAFLKNDLVFEHKFWEGAYLRHLWYYNKIPQTWTFIINRNILVYNSRGCEIQDQYDSMCSGPSWCIITWRKVVGKHAREKTHFIDTFS